jgi:L-ascorbate metabolism protein UlaG (beta-lactamase superfamily)
LIQNAVLSRRDFLVALAGIGLMIKASGCARTVNTRAATGTPATDNTPRTSPTQPGSSGAPSQPGTSGTAVAPSAVEMPALRVQWFAQSSFLITTSSGTKIVTDPYTPTANYSPIAESADIVTISHDHADHNNTAAVLGNPQVIRASTVAKGIRFEAIASYHDDVLGKQRGGNAIFAFEADQMRLCHLGDLGQLLSGEQLAAIGAVDVLFIPVGGYYTIDAVMASRVADQLKPKVIIPMHFATEKMISSPLSPVDNFLIGKESIERYKNSEVQFVADSLPAGTQIVVLKPSR